MKKILNISVIAALAILPMAANAAVGDIVAGSPDNITDVDPVQAANAVTATADPKYALAKEGANDGNVATAGYVKGAYNAAIKAINKVSETANSAVKGVQVNGTDLTLGADGKANVTVTTGDSESGNGTIKVNGAPVSVYGLGSAAYVNTGDIAGTANTYNDTVSQLGATTIQGAIQALDTAIDGLGNTYATQDGVETTVTNAINGAKVDLSGIQATTGTLSGSVQAVATWGTDALAANPVPVTLTQGTVVIGLTGNEANLSNKISAGTVSYPANP